MTIKNITILGAGVLGAQIAFQSAFKGFSVSVYDINDAAIEKSKKTFQYLKARYLEDIDGANTANLDAAYARIAFFTNIENAVNNADLVIEAVPEKLEIKQQVYAQIAKAAPERTIFASNSSTLLPSAMASSTGRTDRFIALHFANEIWVHNIAEIMGSPETSKQTYETVVQFARDIGMVPVQLQKEQPGYVLNSLLVPFLSAASALLVDNIASVEDIDHTWKIATGAPKGPFEIYDIVGLMTAYNISSSGGAKQQKFAQLLKENYIDKGKLGIITGEGFYKYQ
jgi:3-hydroxybutyryl-CoA dehydrogenase